MNTNVQNPNDHKVVTFKNATDFDFTPEMGAMYDGRPIFGISGKQFIEAGESIVLPYHVGNLLALNLAKVAITNEAPAKDEAGVPTGVPLWDETKLSAMKSRFIENMYEESAPINMSETDRLMAKVDELNDFVKKNVVDKDDTPEEPTEEVKAPQVFQDKQEVIAELEKQKIQHDKRKSKAELETLLA